LVVQVASWLAFFAIGVVLQRRGDAARLNRRLWTVYFFTVAPAAIAYAYTTITPSRTLIGALVVAAVSSWLVLGVAAGFGVLVGRSRPETGAIALAGGFGNTAALGYPFAQLVFGTHGLALQVLYAQFYYGVPGIAISTSVARLTGETQRAPAGRRGTRALLASPPLVAAAVAVALRLVGVDATAVVTPLGHAAGLVSGPLGFLQLGVALPLGRFLHDRGDLGRAGGVLVVRHLVAPLVIVMVGAAAGISIPGVFILAAAAPVAFHIVTLGQVFGVRPELLRLLVVVSTLVGTLAVAVIAAVQ
jgi:predicted permease